MTFKVTLDAVGGLTVLLGQTAYDPIAPGWSRSAPAGASEADDLTDRI
jgi:hypothetical protein